MRFLISSLFKTISRQVEKEISESLYTNDVFMANRWNYIERNIILWSKNYSKYVALLLVLVFFVITNLIFWKPWLKPLVLGYLPSWRVLLEWQQGILTGQLTIVGVVYPLVIGLISILFQNKSAKKTIFPI